MNQPKTQTGSTCPSWTAALHILRVPLVVGGPIATAWNTLAVELKRFGMGLRMPVPELMQGEGLSSECGFQVTEMCLLEFGGPLAPLPPCSKVPGSTPIAKASSFCDIPNVLRCCTSRSASVVGSGNGLYPGRR
jgi:hypothetical protein